VRSFRIVIAARHAAAAMLATAELICGEIPDLTAVGLASTETPDHYADSLRAAIGHDHRPILVLADLLGGTPFNVASAIARRSPRLVCVAGVNLADGRGSRPLRRALDDALVERLIEVGRSGIVETERHRARRVS